ncbi:hypothetical protein QE152_g36645 [Popillia japonica]|uniref:Uncharacterized protein n=1 Tax=Popillia japonica TaxID=7064 RepID=A0AAW1ICY1_POPJA
MNVLYGILLVNLLVTPISVHGCVNTEININITNHECLKHFVSYKDIKLVKWNIAKITTLGKVSHIEVRDKFILLTPSYDFIHPKEYIEYTPSGNTKSTDLAFVEYTNWGIEEVLITLTEREDPYQINNSTPAIPYDNSTSSNTVKIYTSEKWACVLNRGYLILNAKWNVLCGIGLPLSDSNCYKDGLPLSDSNCYKEFLARHIQQIDMTGILQYMHQISTFPEITTSYTCMVVAFSAVVVL